MPSKTFTDTTVTPSLAPLVLPEGCTVTSALDRVLRLLSVASKRFLTTKVDRSVTGLVAQQQCVGPLHIPISDCAVIAQSHFAEPGAPTTGIVSSIGEQPIKGLLSAGALARLSIGEALTNMAFTKCTARTDIKCSGNWMWAAKFPGEAAAMYEVADAMNKTLQATHPPRSTIALRARARALSLSLPPHTTLLLDGHMGGFLCPCRVTWPRATAAIPTNRA